MNLTRGGWAFGFLVLLLTVDVICGQSTPPEQPVVTRPLANATLAPALSAVAERDGIDLTTKDAGEGTGAAGDTVVAWIGATQGERFQQWLIQFKRGTATAAEQRAHAKKDVKKYLSWGAVETFESDVEAIDLWVAGPVEIQPGVSPPPEALPPVRRKRVFVAGAYLRLGLDNTERVHRHIYRRVAEIRKEDLNFTGGNINSLDKPIKPENIAWAKPVAEKIGFTPEMGRAWVGGYVALDAFYRLANDEPILGKIAEIALKKPPTLKLAKLAFGTQFMTSFGGPEARPLDPAAVGLLPVGLESFEVPYSFGFGKDLIVSGWMVVTAPNPPTDLMAGILAVSALHPTDPNRAVDVILISAARASKKKLAEKN